MSYETILYEREGPVATITLNRPEQLNTIVPPMPVLDGCMRNTPEGLRFVETAATQGVRAAVTERDRPFGDYSQAPPSRQPARGHTIDPRRATSR